MIIHPTLRQVLLLSAMVLVATPAPRGQSVQKNQTNDKSGEVPLERNSLLSDLQTLESRARKLEPLPRASAKAEIADAAWTVDREWSKKLLREACELTFPDEEEQLKLRSRPMGSAPTSPSSNQIARNAIRNRVLQIASRDKALTDELTQLSEKTLGKLEALYLYSNLAAKSIEAGDNEPASDYLLKAIDADPTMLNVGSMIFQMAARDRKAADNLIVQYIERLRSFPVSQSNGSALRTYMFLRDLVANNSGSYLALVGKSGSSKDPPIQPPGPMVMRAYVGYVIESLGALEQREPGSAIGFRGTLLSVWLPLNQYAPEFLGSFFQVEKLSRRAGEDGSLPTASDKASGGTDTYEQRVKKALDSDQPDDLIINIAIGRGDFDKARKMIDKLPDDSHKGQLIENVNAPEAIALAEKGEIDQAVRLAERLTRATSILQVYPVLLKKCLSAENKWRATPLVYQAIKQLKKADTTSIPPPPGMPETAVAGKSYDFTLLSLSRLAKSVLEVDETLALAVLDETVIAANKSSVDSSEGRVGFDLDVFKRLAPKNEERVHQAAEDLTDHFRQIVALAAINQWKASELEKKSRVELTKRKAK
jgi:tetratricopeptide (TPR) repeat protein